MFENILIVIPARGGSKGIPKKNMKVFAGYPLFYWSVFAAIESKAASKTIVVSSDDPETLDACKVFGDKVVPLIRPKEISGDLSSTEEAMYHAFKSVGSRHEKVFLLQPTSPLRPKGMLDDALQMLASSGKKSLMSVSEHTPFFVQMTPEKPLWHYDVHNRPMRQSLRKEEMYYHDDGSLYIVNAKVFSITRCRLNLDPCFYMNQKYCSLQVDTPEDFLILENIWRQTKAEELYVNPQGIRES